MIRPNRFKVVDGVPILFGRETRPRTFRVRPKKRKRKSDYGIKKMTKQEKQALQNYFEGGMTNKGQAAIAAGYEVSNASNIIPRLLKRKPIAEALEKRGITKEKIAEIIADGLEAMHPMHPKQKDQNARYKFVTEANKILDNYPPKKVQVEERSVVLHLGREDYEAMEHYEELRKKDV